jgi:hypothetical protein
MKPLFRLSPLLLSLVAACQSSPSMPIATSAAEPAKPVMEQATTQADSTSAVGANAVAANPERIQDELLTVNGKPHRQLTTQALLKQLGRPDSIAKGAVECGSVLDIPINSPEGDFWYYGKTMYDVNGDQAILYLFDVTTGKFHGNIGKLALNQNTTLEDVRRFYPLSAKQVETDSGTISLPFEHGGQLMDSSLHLIFKKGRLQEVEFYFPC